MTLTGYTFTATCAGCGGTLEPLASGQSSRTDVRAVAECVTCGASWLLTLGMSRVKQPLRRPPPACAAPNRPRTVEVA